MHNRQGLTDSLISEVFDRTKMHKKDLQMHICFYFHFTYRDFEVNFLVLH